jgi:hypothetical protein
MIMMMMIMKIMTGYSNHRDKKGRLIKTVKLGCLHPVACTRSDSGVSV